ncbi:unnamed protein product [Linum trigynum]|uniref:YqaJ viral recombinase domain-containing protein n=1 Tax=Linum trigynum TaxID=586398 RepID=A0AAV2EIN2_9ROSI
MLSTSHKLSWRVCSAPEILCTKWWIGGRLSFLLGNGRNYRTQACREPSIEQFQPDPLLYNHRPVYGHPPVRNFSSDPLHEAKSLQHWYKNWQERRKTKLTASTFGGAIGLWRGRRVQLWLEKIGAEEPFKGNWATWWGNVKEKEALQRYKLITGHDIAFPLFQLYGERDPEHDWIAASPDGLIEKPFYGLPSRGVLEIKCPFFDDMKDAKPWKRIPLYYIPQAQGLLEIMDRDWMDFYMWTPRGSSLFRVHRDREYWNVMRLALSDFWLNHVLPARELCSTKNIKNPRVELPSLRPAPKHESCDYIIKESRRIVDASPLLIREIDGVLQPIWQPASPTMNQHDFQDYCLPDSE